MIYHNVNEREDKYMFHWINLLLTDFHLMYAQLINIVIAFDRVGTLLTKLQRIERS